ncbi:MAG: hypothetical protein V1862_09265 [Methanobacteriota archaeon]
MLRTYRNTSRLFILLTGFLLILGFFTIPTLADPNKTITINPIGDHTSGEKFNITGTTTLENSKKIGIEIFPKKYWDSASEYAKEGDAGRIIFMEIASSKENFHPAGIKLVRSNLDGTQSSEELALPQDHWTSIFPLKKSSAGEREWSFQIDKNENGTPLSPGSYHVNVWDASTDVQHPGTNMSNGWDIIQKKIYPSTARANVWDIKNQKDVEYAEFTIRSG